ncbi:MAG: transposase [Proteobacteria bacterium]|nr:transposase [Pseudomonadota bacterium]
MPRPTRIEYEHATYHVMNRGRGRQAIFHGEPYYQCFLSVLSETHQRFGLEIIAYCLMGNHYHLLVRTPRANLGRCMRHINGLYTQAYNRLRKADGALFRGRYKAILVEADNYLLPLSRYIHRNPIETKRPLVKTLADYPWSSYPAYINQISCPDWLAREPCYGLLGRRQRYKGYKDFVEVGNDKEMTAFYDKKALKPILGSDDFVEQVLQRADDKEASGLTKGMAMLPTIKTIVEAVSTEFDQGVESILSSPRGRGSKNVARWVAMVLCRDVGSQTLSAIAKAFHVGHISSINQAKKKLDKELERDKCLGKRLKLLYQELLNL